MTGTRKRCMEVGVGRTGWTMVVGLALAAALVPFRPAQADPLGVAGDRGDPLFEEEGEGAWRATEARKRLEDKVLREWVGLEGEALERARAVIAQHAEEKARLRRTMRRAMRKMRGLLMAEVDDDAAYRAAVSDFRRAARRLQALRDEEFDALAKILTPKQQARLLLALGKLARSRRHAPPGRPGKAWRRKAAPQGPVPPGP